MKDFKKKSVSLYEQLFFFNFMKFFALFALFGIAPFCLGGCQDSSLSLYSPPSQEQMQLSPLSETEKTDLLFLREEEKLAYDVYKALEKKWGAKTFTNISGSESRHTSQVAQLLTQYSIPDPVQNNTLGVFVNTDLQKLYTDLVAKGSVSLEEAMKVGAFIEEYDIKDIQEKKINTSNPAILSLYDRLEKGSQNHLRAFSKQISHYTPQILSQEEYTKILQGNNEMKEGNGNRRGNGNH